MKRSIVFSTRVWRPQPIVARAAEAAGFARVWTTDGPQRDGLVRAAALVTATSRIEVGTGIILGFARNPITIAAAATDLQMISGGRFVLGIGAGTRGLRRQYGVEIEKMAPWLEELVTIVRQATSPEGAAVSFAGDYFKVQLSGARGLPPEEVPAQAPIYGAAINPIMIQRVGKCCDGIVLLSVGIGERYFEDVVVPAWQRGREKGGRDPARGFTSWCVTAVDPDRERARMMARRQLAFYFSTPSYRAPSEAQGFQRVVAELDTTFKSMRPIDWDRLARIIPDEMVDMFAVAGTAEEVATRLAALEARLARGGVEEMALQLPTLNLDDASVERLALAVIAACSPNAASARAATASGAPGGSPHNA